MEGNTGFLAGRAGLKAHTKGPEERLGDPGGVGDLGQAISPLLSVFIPNRRCYWRQGLRMMPVARAVPRPGAFLQTGENCHALQFPGELGHRALVCIPKTVPEGGLSRRCKGRPVPARRLPDSPSVRVSHPRRNQTER